MMTDVQDATLPEIALMLAPAIAANAAFDGWGDAARDLAADAKGVDRDVAALAYPGGAVDMIDAWFRTIDATMQERLPPERLATMKIRARITALVEARIDAVAGEIEALRRAFGILGQPQHALRAARLGWRTADTMWRAAGDTAVDYNHYTKRAILGSVYGATMLVLLDDTSVGQTDTRAFLTRRIDGIMRFEKAKAQVTKGNVGGLSLSRFLGRLRYPVG